MKILFSGSRQAAPKLLEFARLLTLRAWYAGHEILVGDAVGIDAQVVKTAEISNAPYRCFGVTPMARNGAKNYINVRPQLTKALKPHAGYTHRDRLMVQEADMVICIWNGRSEGTRRVFEFAITSAKRAYLYNGNRLVEKFELEEMAQ